MGGLSNVVGDVGRDGSPMGSSRRKLRAKVAKGTVGHVTALGWLADSVVYPCVLEMGSVWGRARRCDEKKME